MQGSGAKRNTPGKPGIIIKCNIQISANEFLNLLTWRHPVLHGMEQELGDLFNWIVNNYLSSQTSYTGETECSYTILRVYCWKNQTFKPEELKIGLTKSRPVWMLAIESGEKCDTRMSLYNIQQCPTWYQKSFIAPGTFDQRRKVKNLKIDLRGQPFKFCISLGMLK